MDAPLCGICKGQKEVGRIKAHKIRCPSCLGTGLSAVLFDVDGKQLQPDQTVRILPQVLVNTSGVIMTNAKGEEVKTSSYTGEVRELKTTASGVGVVTILANPKHSKAKKAGDTPNHGYRSARPEQVRIIRTTQQKREAQYQKAKEAKKNEGS